MYTFWERADGSPGAKWIWTGMVENKPGHILAAAFVQQNVINLARASFAAWQAARTAASVPSHVRRVLDEIKNSNGSPPSGYKGGKIFKNDARGGGQSLPKADANGRPITYREYDVHPHQSGVNRDAERIVRGSDGRAYYSNDHYKTFTKIE